MTSLPSSLQENCGFKAQELNEQAPYEGPDDVAEEPLNHWMINDLVLFVDSEDTPRIPKQLFDEVTEIRVAGVPGPVYRGHIEAFRQLAKIVLFILLVFWRRSCCSSFSYSGEDRAVHPSRIQAKIVLFILLVFVEDRAVHPSRIQAKIVLFILLVFRRRSCCSSFSYSGEDRAVHPARILAKIVLFILLVFVEDRAVHPSRILAKIVLFILLVFVEDRAVHPPRIYRCPVVRSRLQDLDNQPDARDTRRRVSADDSEDVSGTARARRGAGNGQFQEQDGRDN